MSRSYHGIRSGHAAVSLVKAGDGEPTVFRDPFVMHHQRRCRVCRDYVTVTCLGGASAPPRDPHYRCTECRTDVPDAFPRRLLELVQAEEAPQLELGAEAISSEATETLNPENKEAATRTAPEKTFGEDFGEPIQRGGQTSSGGVR